jgi:hypothetical protein
VLAAAVEVELNVFHEDFVLGQRLHFFAKAPAARLFGRLLF